MILQYYLENVNRDSNNFEINLENHIDNSRILEYYKYVIQKYWKRGGEIESKLGNQKIFGRKWYFTGTRREKGRS